MQWRQPEEGLGPQSSGDWGERSGWMDDDDDDDNVLCEQVGPSNISNTKVVPMTILSFFLKLSNYYQRK